jgi:hypothetical protein
VEEESAHTLSLLLRQDQVLKAEETRLLDLLKSKFDVADAEEEQEEEQDAPQVGHEGREDGGGGARGGGGTRWISRGVCYDVANNVGDVAKSSCLSLDLFTSVFASF